MKIEFMSLKQWLDIYPKMKEQEVECKECSGEGCIECIHCGHSETCIECNGKEIVKDASTLYERQKQEDIDLLKKLNLYDYRVC